MTDAYERILWRGFEFDRMTVQAIEAAEKLLGYKLKIYQGSYNGGAGKVSQSAGTHDGGGAIDVDGGLLPNHVARCLRVVGFAAWPRTPADGPWDAHVHAVLNGNERLSPVAARQVEAYKAGRNGLKSNLPDPTWRPSPIKPYIYKEDDVPAEDVWNYPLKNAAPDGSSVQQPAGRLLTDMEKNIDNQAVRLSRIEKDLAAIKALLEARS